MEVEEEVEKEGSKEEEGNRAGGVVRLKRRSRSEAVKGRKKRRRCRRSRRRCRAPKKKSSTVCDFLCQCCCFSTVAANVEVNVVLGSFPVGSV